MAAKYHISDGELRICTASKQACKLGAGTLHIENAGRRRILDGVPATDDEISIALALKQQVPVSPVKEADRLRAEISSLLGPDNAAKIDRLLELEQQKRNALNVKNFLNNLPQQISAKNWIRRNLDLLDEMSWNDTAAILVNYLPAQSYGKQLENRFRDLRGWDKVSPSLNRGDVRDPATNAHYEVKFTVVKEIDGYYANFVQIRPYQHIDGYHLLMVEENGRTASFYLTKEQMTGELEATGNRLAHGVREETLTGREEYAIRFYATPGTPIYDRWIAKYKIPFEA